MTSNETSFALLKSIISEDVDTYVPIIKYIKNFGEFPKKPVDSSGCAASIGSSNHMTEDIARDLLKDLFEPLISQLREEKGRSEDQGRYLWWLLQSINPNIYCEKCLWGKERNIIGSLESHIGILDDEFEEILAAGKLSKICSWYNNLGLHVQTHKYNSITWINFDKEFTPFKWAHLPRNQIIG